ncbi:MAG: translocation/assembly module TamB domain-containing protein [Prevotella sp.]|nr:translocation/assembly module TamB domain-containing protein [Prevotella sp.]
MKKALKWIVGIILTPILLFLLLIILLYIPPIQNWVAQKVASYASEKTGMDISVGHVSLKFPLDLTVEDFKMIKPNDSIPNQRDTIADVGELVASVQLMPLFKGKVEVDELTLRRTNLNTNGFIPSARVKGRFNELSVVSHGIDLGEEGVKVDKAALDGAILDVALSDTVPPDTTESNAKWRILVDKLNITKSDVTLHMPGDTMVVGVGMGKLVAENGRFDLGKGEYALGRMDWNDGSLRYDNRFAPRVKGLDTNHLALSDVNIGIDSLHFLAPDISVNLRDCNFREQSGLAVNHLSGPLHIDDQAISVPALELQTEHSRLSAHVEMDLNAFADQHPGELFAQVDGYIGKEDIMRFGGGAMPPAMVRKWPNRALNVSGQVRGNLQRLALRNMNVTLPTAFNMTATGTIDNVTDFDRMNADIKLKGTTNDLGFVTAALDPATQKMIRVPQGIGLDGRFRKTGSRLGADFTATQGGGKMVAKANIDTRQMAYDADVKAQAFPLQNFLPGYRLSPLTGTIVAKGQGTDIFSPSTKLKAKANLTKFSAMGYDLSAMKIDANIDRGRMLAEVEGHNSLFDGMIYADGRISRKNIDANISTDFYKADLYKLGLSDSPMTLGMCANLRVKTDMNSYYDIQGEVNDLRLNQPGSDLAAETVDIDVLLNRDTTHVRVNSGDFELALEGKGGYQKILNKGQRLGKEISKMIAERKIDDDIIRENLPDVDIYMTGGGDNLLSRMFEEKGITYKQVYVNMYSSHVNGLNGDVKVDSLMINDMLFDRVRFAINTDSTGFKYNAEVQNFEGNPTYVFRAKVDGSLFENGSDLSTRIYDANDSLGVKLGLRAQVRNDSLCLNFSDLEPVIGYKKFRANEYNYLRLGKKQRLAANVYLAADDGTNIHLYTNDENMDADQDLTLSMQNLNLGDITAAVPFLPDITGILDGDFHVVKTEKQLTVSSSVSVDDMTFEKNVLGDLSSEFVYMPNEDGSHYIDAVIYSDQREVGTVVGTYYPEGKGRLDADFNLARMPLSLLNSFMPDQILGFKGYGEGTLKINGPLSTPNINGEILLDSAYINSVPYGVQLRVDNRPVRIDNSKLLFEDFKLYAHNDQPLTLNGQLNFSNLDRMTIDLRMSARDFEIINAKETPKAEAYGRAFINMFGRLQGPLDAFQMKGRVDVLGKTDLTYVLKDSPLAEDTRLDELVQFVDFSDSTTQVVNRPPISGLDMDLTLNVDEGARIRCDLNPDHSNYVDIMGEGNLRLLYNVANNFRITGRYTVNSGEMKYSLPIIPLRTFTIKEGGYLEFQGAPDNPKVNITATEKVKAVVTDEGGGSRSVDFECGVVITKTLQDMGLQFIIDAPEDLSVSGQLGMMSEEDRGRLAVAMISTGMYMADGNESALSMNSALSSFLQAEINNITGNALRTLDLSIGVDNATDATGAMHTDYSFKFAKRFWNNRLRVVIGGKVSTGSDVYNRNQTFFDNVTFEYRISPNSNKYLRLFYDRSTYDWFEGEIGEFGAGFMWKRKLDHLKDIFNFKSDERVPRSRSDSLRHVRRDTTAIQYQQKP